MEELLTSIIDRLTSMQASLGLSYIDEEYGQVDMLDDESRDSYPVTFPAVTVDLRGASWKDLSTKMQQADAEIAVNVYIDCYDDTHYGSGTIAKVTDRMALVRKVTEAVQGWHPSNCSRSLTRVSSTAETNNHGIKRYQITFSASAYESFDKPLNTVKNVTLSPKAEVV